jgi:DNA-binding CsgD family transcriptional regulator
LNALLKHLQEEKEEIEERILFNIRESVFPYLHKIKNTAELNQSTLDCLETIENNLHQVASPFSKRLLSSYHQLTPGEIRVAQLIRDGKTSKEIAELLNVSKSTVDFHRNSLRKKLRLKGEKANLRSFLIDLS